MRAIAAAVAALFLCASPGFAQSVQKERHTTRSVQAARPDFSSSAAGIDRMAAAAAPRDTAPTAARRTSPAQSSGGRSFWKTPWPYVIIGGVAAAVIIASAKSDNGLY
jgi:hypothetical protein